MARKKTKAITRYRKRCAKVKCAGKKLKNPTKSRCCQKVRRRRK
jgi:hypothetical protein